MNLNHKNGNIRKLSDCDLENFDLNMMQKTGTESHEHINNSAIETFLFFFFELEQ